MAHELTMAPTTGTRKVGMVMKALYVAVAVAVLALAACNDAIIHSVLGDALHGMCVVVCGVTSFVLAMVFVDGAIGFLVRMKRE